MVFALNELKFLDLKESVFSYFNVFFTKFLFVFFFISDELSKERKDGVLDVLLPFYLMDVFWLQ